MLVIKNSHGFILLTSFAFALLAFFLMFQNTKKGNQRLINTPVCLFVWCLWHNNAPPLPSLIYPFTSPEQLSPPPPLTWCEVSPRVQISVPSSTPPMDLTHERWPSTLQRSHPGLHHWRPPSFCVSPHPQSPPSPGPSPTSLNSSFTAKVKTPFLCIFFPGHLHTESILSILTGFELFNKTCW